MSATAVAPGGSESTVPIEGIVEEASATPSSDMADGGSTPEEENHHHQNEEIAEPSPPPPSAAATPNPQGATSISEAPDMGISPPATSEAHDNGKSPESPIGSGHPAGKTESQSELSQASGRSTPSHPPGGSEVSSKNPSSVGAEQAVAGSNRNEAGPLPQNLRRILMEVAKTGACSWLPWDQDAKEQHLLTHHHHNVSEGVSGLTSTLSNSVPASSSSYLLNKSLGGFATSAQPFSTHRRSTSSPYPSGGSQPRKSSKQRNGLHKKRRRYMGSDGSNTQTTTPRKRPLFLIRTNTNTNPNTSVATPGSTTATQTATATAAAPGSVYSAGSIASSVGSGRTSGSEPDDSTQYECDSEGTSATTNSEFSVEGRIRKRNAYVHHGHGIARMKHPKEGDANLNTDMMEDEDEPSMSSNGTTYTTLQGAFRIALQLVLDHFNRHCGGYKLSPAERRRIDMEAGETNHSSDNEKKKSNDSQQLKTVSSDTVFQQRRQRLVNMLTPKFSKANKHTYIARGSGPPFTIQRVAEVLVSPERYYTQTHKLCNCLEKLLLVSSSTEAFGGITGGKTAQSRREELEMAALADERARQEKELRERRLKRRASSPIDESNNDGGNDSRMTEDEAAERRKELSPEKRSGEYDSNSSPGRAQGDGSTREKLEAAARASLRTKFDHVGIDPHSSPDRDVRSIAESRGMTSSPPPPGLALASAPNIPLAGHGVSGFVRQHEQGADNPSIARVPSPIMFSQAGGDPDIHGHSSSPNMHMLQLHHAAALAGAGNSRPPTHLDLALHDKRQGGANPDMENEHGRSSASNSDVDSESDDLSLDDSASDRSDGSDSGSLPHYEPFTAARAMALNRMQQQQRLQSRNLTSFNLHQSGFRPPADSEYQSGDSIDSMRAEDSGSDSSSVSSDIAD